MHPSYIKSLAVGLLQVVVVISILSFITVFLNVEKIGIKLEISFQQFY